MELKETIYNYLETHCQGRQHAIKYDELSAKFSLEPIPWRHIAKIIEELRQDGKPIATCGQGAFIPISLEEKKACLRTIYRRTFNTLKMVRLLEKTFGSQIVKEVNEEFNQLEDGQLELKIC